MSSILHFVHPTQNLIKLPSNNLDTQNHLVAGKNQFITSIDDIYVTCATEILTPFDGCRNRSDNCLSYPISNIWSVYSLLSMFLVIFCSQTCKVVSEKRVMLFNSLRMLLKIVILADLPIFVLRIVNR